MTVQRGGPDVVIGIGGAGCRLARDVKEALGCKTLLISHDPGDIRDGAGILIPTDSMINPSVQALRGFALGAEGRIREELSGRSSAVMMCNLAGRGGAAIAPVVSRILRGRNLACFAVMPFGYEGERLFAAGVALRRLRGDADFVVLADNDAVLDANPCITPSQCYSMMNSAMVQVASSLDWPEAGIVSASRRSPDVMASLRDALKALYGSAVPGSVKRSVIHIMGGDSVPLGVIRSVREMTSQVLGDGVRVEVSANASGGSEIVMVSSVEGQTRFERYDPLGAIPTALDWDEPECTMACGLDMRRID